MPFCKQGLCMNETDDGYCAEHGGGERRDKEWAAEADRAEARVHAQDNKPKGQAVAEGRGLSRFLPQEERERRCREKTDNRAEREAHRKALRQERLKAQPPKGSNAKSNQTGTGTSKKARQQQKKHRGHRSAA